MPVFPQVGHNKTNIGALDCHFNFNIYALLVLPTPCFVAKRVIIAVPRGYRCWCHRARCYNHWHLHIQQQFDIPAVQQSLPKSGQPSLFACPVVVEKLAQKYYSQIIEGRLVDRLLLPQTAKNLQIVDLGSVAIENVREIGSE